MRIVLFGPPGAGKGTQASQLVKDYGLTHISTGVLIRRAIAADTEAGSTARKYVHEGKLVPGPIVREMAETAIAEADFDRFILDGYPRTIEQAEWLTDFLKKHDAPIQAVISLKVDTEVIVGRLSQRRVNVRTGENYHLEFSPPPDDVSSEDIIQRKDDQPEAIRHRLRVYEEQTHPVEEFFRQQGVLTQISGDASVEEVSNRIHEVLQQVAA